MNRILNAKKYLFNIVEEGKTFYIGFGGKTVTDLGKKHPGLKGLIEGTNTSVLVTGKKGVLKENTFGKWVRKQPESKETVIRHIHYYSERAGRDVDFDREFNIYEKEIKHKFNLALEAAKTPQGETILHFPALKMADSADLYLKAGAEMNMAILLGEYFMTYDNIFEPIVPVTKVEHRRILGSGTFSLAEKLEIIDKEIMIKGDGEIGKGNSYRFALLKEKKPSDVTMGIGGFDEYLMFEYVENDLMILENLKTGNATFLFKLSTFDKTKELNKQNASTDPAFLKRIVHNNLDDWKKRFNIFFN